MKDEIQLVINEKYSKIEISNFIRMYSEILDENKNQRLLENVNPYEFYEILYKSTIKSDEKKANAESELDELNKFWKGKFIKIETASPNGYPEEIYYRISRIGKNPYGLETDVVAYTDYPGIKIIKKDGKSHYEIIKLSEIKDNSTNETTIDKFTSYQIRERKLDPESEAMYIKVYRAAVDYYANFDITID